MTFRRLELVDLQHSFPVLDNSEDVAPSDLLVVVGGFEERTIHYVQKLSDAGVSVPQAVVLRYPTNVEENEAMMARLEVALGKVTSEVTKIDISEIEIELEAAILRVRDSTEHEVRITFDLSGASGRMILRVVRALFEIARTGAQDLSLRIAYTEAEEYSPSKADAESILRELKKSVDLLSAGDAFSVGPDWDADESGTVVEYMGQSSENVPERAVVICGFNANRVRVALDAVDPAFNADVPHPNVTYIAGAPPAPELAWRLDVMKEINSLGADPAGFDFIDVSTLDYMETLGTLERIYQAGFGNERLTVIPFGSKMQTLAAALFCEMHPEVRAQLVAPARYVGVDYSKGSGSSHSLDFGNLRQLANNMEELGSLHLEKQEGAVTGWSANS
jgi:hypothetical protein